MQFTSQVLAQVRGSMGGITASHNRFGNYFKARTNPVNPNTSRQQFARAVFSALAARWNTVLTQVQRTGWNFYGAAVSMPGPFGLPINLTGFNHYQRSNGANAAAGLGVVDTPPTDLSLPEADSSFAVTISEATQQLSVTFDILLDWVNLDDAAFIVYMSAPVTAGRTFMNTHTRTAGAILGDSTTPPTPPELIAVPFAVAAGQNVAVLARIVEPDGRASTLFQVTVSVAA